MPAGRTKAPAGAISCAWGGLSVVAPTNCGLVDPAIIGDAVNAVGDPPTPGARYR